MTALLDEGAGELDAQGFAIRSQRNWPRGSVSIRRARHGQRVGPVPDRNRAAIALLNTALTQPRFDADAVERVRGQMIASLRRDALDPNTIASRAFAEAPIPAIPMPAQDGTPDSVAALTRDDLSARACDAIARDRVHIGVAGDIDAAALGPAAGHPVRRACPTDGAACPRTPVSPPTGCHRVPFDGPQSVIAFGHRGIPRDDPDFLTAYVVNEIVGGGRFGTRLMAELREKRGLTYGVGSFLASGFLGESYQGRFRPAMPTWPR